MKNTVALLCQLALLRQNMNAIRHEAHDNLLKSTIFLTLKCFMHCLLHKINGQCHPTMFMTSLNAQHYRWPANSALEPHTLDATGVGYLMCKMQRAVADFELCQEFQC